MSTVAGESPPRIVYYAGPTGSPYRLLRLLASLAAAASIDDDLCAAEANLRWLHSGRERELNLSLVVTRTVAWQMPIQELAGDEVRTEVEALRRADVVVFLVDGRTHTLALNQRLVQVLADDLGALGRPHDIPVLFQVHRYREPDGGAVPLPDLVHALTWPRCEYVEAWPREKRGAKEALDRAIEIHDEMQAARGTCGDARQHGLEEQ